jgi:hypothetical protein
LKAEAKAAVAGEVVILVALAILIHTGLVPSSDVASAFAVALVGAVFGIPAWAYRSGQTSEKTEQRPAPNLVKIDDSDDTSAPAPETSAFSPKVKTVADDETIVVKHKEVEDYRITINSKWRLEGKITSNVPLAIFIMSADDFRRFMRGWNFEAIQSRQGAKQYPVNFQPPRKDEWVVVLDNTTKEDAEVTVALKAIQLSP